MCLLLVSLRAKLFVKTIKKHRIYTVFPLKMLAIVLISGIINKIVVLEVGAAQNRLLNL